MGPGRVIKLAADVFMARFFSKNIPLVVGWAVTYRCNRDCLYCSLKEKGGKELTGPEALSLIDSMADSGTYRVSLTGGEPLLREDIGLLVSRIRARGMESRLNTNGALVEDRIGEIRDLDMMSLSLDGPEEIHDGIRGEGSFREVMSAANAAKKAGIRLSFSSVLTANNIEHLDYILDLASDHGCRVVFQSCTPNVLGTKRPNKVMPGADEIMDTFMHLAEKKKNGDGRIGNSVSVLEYLASPYSGGRMRCASGTISCRIEPDGDVIYCSREKFAHNPLNSIHDGFKKAFDSMGKVYCDECICAPRAGLNMAFGGDISVIYEELVADKG